MLRTKSWLGTSAMVAALLVGMLAGGCGEDKPAGPTASLEGTWNGDWGTFALNKGSFEISAPVFDDRVVYKILKGAYTTSGSTFTATPSHIHSDIIKRDIKERFDFDLPIESKWCTINELKADIKDLLGNAIYESMDVEEKVDYYSYLFNAQSGPYTLSGDNLSITLNLEGAPKTYSYKRVK